MSSDKDIILLEAALEIGSIHPINNMKDSIMNLLGSLGFEVIQGPEIETEEYNFDMLNIKESHPARQMHDTFYVNNKENVLRTHTSPVQIRGMLKNKPPLAFISGGKVYRKDDDATHLPMFHQVEGIYVDEEVTFSQLKGLIYKIIYSLFGEGVKLRFRPSYFPFTEPSAEVDVSCNICSSKGCNVCKYTGYLEILGCGMVDPNVLDNCGIDSKKYTGFAFGMGIERIAMLKYQVDDLRLFYENDIRFLKQFSNSI